MTNFTVTFEQEEGLWFATSNELNCFVANQDLAKICADLPNILALAQKNATDQQRMKTSEEG